MSTQMTMVKDLGYSIIIRDKRFQIEPVPTDDDKEVMHLVEQLRDDVIKAHTVMKGITDWCGSDRKKWGMLRNLVRDHFEDPYGRTPRATLLTWFGNKASYWNGVYRASKADISFFGRVSDKVGELVPESLVRDGEIASLLSKNVGL